MNKIQIGPNIALLLNFCVAYFQDDQTYLERSEVVIVYLRITVIFYCKCQKYLNVLDEYDSDIEWKTVKDTLGSQGKQSVYILLQVCGKMNNSPNKWNTCQNLLNR